MGSICRMNDTNRAAAIFRQDADFLAPLQRFIGATIEGVELSVNDPVGTIAALLTVRMPDGTTEELDGPMLAEDAESGVLGFDLQDRFGQCELRRMLETAIADPDNGLDRHDRDAIREELGRLDDYYGGDMEGRDEQRLRGEPRRRDPHRQGHGAVPRRDGGVRRGRDHTFPERGTADVEAALILLATELACGDDEVHGGEVVAAWKAFAWRFKQRTGLDLGVDYHDPEDGGPYDEVEGAFLSVEGMYEVSPAGRPFVGVIECRSWVTFW